MKKFISILLLFIIILSSLVIYSNASDARVNLVAEGTVSVGSELTATISVEQLGDLSGVYILEGILDYDSQYLEYVGIESANSAYGSPSYSATTKKFQILSANSDVVGPGKAVKFKFKVKSLPTSTVTGATVSKISASDGEIELNFSNVTLTLNPPAQQPVQNTTTPVQNTTKPTNNTAPVQNTMQNTAAPVQNTTNTANTTGNKTSNISGIISGTNGNSANVSGSTSKADNTTSNSIIPKAGINVVIKAAVLTTIIASVYAYIKYRKYNVF